MQEPTGVSSQPSITSPADEAQTLLAFVADRDVSCPACGCNLRMLSKPLCPECGLPLKLTVGSDTPYKRAWAITLILNAMVAGAGLFFLLITTVEGGPPIYELFGYLWYYGAMVWIPTPLIILSLRKWFCRQRAMVQYAIIGLSLVWLCLLSGSLLTTFN